MVLSICCLPGCGTGFAPPAADGDVVDGNGDGSTTSSTVETTREPNDSFAQAVTAVFDGGGTARLQGTVEVTGDLDVFLLGELAAGDRLIVDAATVGSALDVSVAVFDEDERLTVTNDDREGSTDRFLDSYVDWIVRHAGNPYYLVVTNSAFAASSDVVGSYSIDVEISHGHDVPERASQVLLLDFDGAVVNSPVLGSMTIAPFDAADISPVYQGETETLKERIHEMFEQNYERFNVMILTTDDSPPAAGIEYSTVYFGGFNRGAFGMAESVDLYNADFCDDAVIFTESFTPSLFTGVPTALELGVAIGNVGSHEAGHLLGLNHTSDDLDLMDDRSAADAFLDDQEFKEAPLSSDIMPIGTQDGVLLLSEIVGLYDATAIQAMWRNPAGVAKQRLPHSGSSKRFRRH